MCQVKGKTKIKIRVIDIEFVYWKERVDDVMYYLIILNLYLDLLLKSDFIDFYA